MTNTGKSESMVERVARAIALEDLDPETRAAVNPDVWFVAESYFDLARAAIKAMRGPTEAMCEAGRDRHDVYGFGASDARPVFEAMIDAALKE